MNDRHPSGTLAPAPASDADSAPYASYGTQEAQYGDLTTYGGYDATGFAPTGFGTGGHTTATFATDPLFGDLPGDGHDTGTHDTGHYDAYPPQAATGYGTGAYDATAWATGEQHMAVIPPQATGPETSGQWDAGAWLQPDQSGNPADRTQQWDWGTQAFDTGAYDATQWNSDGAAATPAHDGYEQQAEQYEPQTDGYEPQTESYEQQADGYEPQTDSFDRNPYDGSAHDESRDTGELPAVTLLEGQEETVPAPSPRAASRGGSRSRRRTPPKRSALLTVAVPSACVMGVAGIAAASVGNLTDDGGRDTATTAADTAQPVKPSTANIKLDTQLQSLAAGADDFADRASRTQERIDLKAQQEAERKRAAEEAARKERLRPKFALPVAQHGLSAYYGQSGINWMSVHSGIDFPVSFGATVMAATDGVVRTQYNAAYGNMMIVTAMDGTETWYCHLSSYQVPSGTAVKAGQPIAFSGNSGNSTGPHLHFEVRPGGGSAIDPLAWLRSHGLDPS
ncbi:peptidoglycan DD-metalloendopeptidase family protein [Streptomyces sp. NPDC007904]|uniref:M23 family metallopeptidase n=1 Tax=Streptomyces sp. NPDC007904 TaxID=3364787 RepID=UPI0036EC1271